MRENAWTRKLDINWAVEMTLAMPDGTPSISQCGCIVDNKGRCDSRVVSSHRRGG